MAEARALAARKQRESELDYIHEEEDKCFQIEHILHSSQTLTNQMLGILGEFERKLISLETTMLPIHKHTQTLTAAQHNIDLALEQTEQLIEHFDVATEAEEETNDRNIATDPQGYLDWVESVHAATDYFVTNSTFKGADKLLKKLRELNSKAMAECETEFARLCQHASRPLDLSRLPWPLPPTFEVVPSTDVSRMARIAARMQASGSLAHLQQLATHRGACAKQSLRKAVQEGYNPYAPGGGREERGVGALPLSVAGTAVTPTTSAAAGKRVGGYAKGSHRVIFQLHFLLKIIELEYQLFRSILDPASLPPQLFERTFADAIEPPLEWFHRKVDLNFKEKSANKILMLLDVLETLQAIMPQFKAMVIKPSQMDRLAETRGQVLAACRKAIYEYKEYILQYADVKTAKQKDGTLHPLTTETCNFVKRLMDYQRILDVIPVGALLDEQEIKGGSSAAAGAALAPTPSSSASVSGGATAGATAAVGGDSAAAAQGGALSALTTFIFQALERNLDSKARSYKIPALTQLFMLNNYTYIQKHFMRDRGNALAGRDVLARYNAMLRSAQHDYLSATWDAVVKFISLDDAKAVLAKCSPRVQSSAKRAIKAKFTGFNNGFNALYDQQRRWSVPDPDLRSHLRHANVQRVLEPYKNFLATYGKVEFSEKPAKYIQFDPRTLETMLNNFFDEAA